jgi:predicted GNAT family acetyltransferase
MEHVLDNPAWSALISGNKHLANGNDQVRYFDKDVAPFAAFKENTIDHFRVLDELLQRDVPVIFVTSVEWDVPAQWKVLNCVKTFQMIYEGEAKPIDAAPELITLTTEHIPQMLALTKLANPGPFELRTIEFGHYRGIFEGDKLVAMAGQRLHPSPYAEISAVCTHPDHTGKGYARQLLQYQANRIIAAGDIPILHVRTDNDRAIKVYESLGFAVRTYIYFYVIQKAS